MASNTGFHVTREDLRKAESEESKKHGGHTPADSDVSALKSIVDQHKSSSNPSGHVELPLPEDPPVPGDMKSADARLHTGTGSGRFSGDVAGEKDPFRTPVTASSAVREDGEVLKKNTTV